MKKFLVVTACFSMMAAVVFAQAPKKAPGAKNNPVEDTIQYSLGVYMMQLLSKTGFTVTDPVFFNKAVNDVIAKKPLMITEISAQNRLLAYQQAFQFEKGRRYEQLLINKVKAEGVFKELPGNVFYQVSQAGTGLRPAIKDTVIINMIITLPDGTEVDNSNKTKQSYMVLVRDMVPGLQDVLTLMNEGAIFRTIVPAAKGNGERGTAAIPPNSAVIYDIGLVSVRKGK